MRVVSLLPSATEIVCLVGGREFLVGVSHECDFPAGVVGLPALTRMRREMPRASGAIDRAVRDLVRETLGVFEVDGQGLRALEPDVVVTQDLCEVCAVPRAEVEGALCALTGREVRIVSCQPTRLEHVFGDVRRVGEALGLAARAEEEALRLERRIEELRQRTSGLSRLPVLTIEWIDPVMVGGTWMPELVEIAGGEALVTKPGDHAPTLCREALAQLDPEVVILKPCGFGLGRAREELPALARCLPLESWRAAREGRMFLADGNAFFNRPGPRLVESAEILAACIHPRECADLRERHRSAICPLGPGGEALDN